MPPTTAQRRTLARPAHLAGITLFTAVHTSVEIAPAPAGTGLSFRRTDHPDTRPIPARADHLAPEPRRTVLSAEPASRNAATVQTVEHILSALAGLGITDAMIHVDGPEIPLADGSARPFVDAVLAAGVIDLAGPPLSPITPASHVFVEDSTGARIDAYPPDAPGLSLEYRLAYDASIAPWAPSLAQSATLDLPLSIPADASSPYAATIAPARTFSLAPEAQFLRAQGLFGHLDPEQMLVIGERGPLHNSYRFPNELARHKLLDLLGDLALTGRPLHARVVASRSGHALNHALARRLLA